MKKSSRWVRLLPGLKELEDTLDVVAALQQLLQLIQQVGPRHSAGIFLLDEETRTIQGQVTELFDRDLDVGHGALQVALRQNAPFVISDLTARPRPPCEEENACAQIVVPFRLPAQARGALVLRSREPHAFSQADGEALAQFALGVSSRIENALIRQKMLRVGEAEVEHDLVMAQEIMARLIPREPPQIPGFEVASAYVPAKVVGGDLIDYVSVGDDHFGFMVADAAGNGVAAALLMTGFRALFRGLIKNDFTIRSVFRKAHNQLLESTGPHQFVSAFYASLDTSTHRLIYVNGGHVPPLLYRPRHPVRRLDVGGPVLGILQGASFHEDSVVLRPQDILVCYSDGLSEIENAKGDAFDTHRILRVVEAHQRGSAEAICGALQEEASRFAGHPARDDLTICVLKFP
ncbi:MAG TPA: GAF domain-containing SpoIIE family protein phosphatase [Terriglobia bacterium]